MIIVNHRINTIKQLADVPIQNGAELDVRYHENTLVMHHDPFGHHETQPQIFSDFLKTWQHQGPMILNIKTEGIEQLCIDLMNQYSIKKWFFLDLSMPCFTIYAQHALNHELKGFCPENLAVRFSQYEPIEYALAFSKKVKWVWVDCFTYLPMDEKIHATLKEAGFKICLVSPELHKHPVTRIKEFQKQIAGLDIDAVCTKHPNLWGQDAPSEANRAMGKE